MCGQNELNRITNEVAKAANTIFKDKLDSVILFGSYARGDYDSESDIDIMILVDASDEELKKHDKEIDRIASRLSLSTVDCVTICVILKDKETFQRYSQALPFYSNVIREGVKIYAA